MELLEEAEFYLRRKISLEQALEDIGKTKVSTEIESQMMFIEERMSSKLKQAYRHAMQEMDAMRFVLLESEKTDDIS